MGKDKNQRFSWSPSKPFSGNKGDFSMAQPKKQSSPRKTGLRRSHLVLKLARRVNGTSPVKVKTTKRETGKKSTK